LVIDRGVAAFFGVLRVFAGVKFFAISAMQEKKLYQLADEIFDISEVINGEFFSCNVF
jgi:hypothetical protein